MGNVGGRLLYETAKFNPSQNQNLLTHGEYGEIKARYGRSKSYKVIEAASNWKPMCDFLLVFYCNYMPVLYRFRDITMYWSKILLCCLKPSQGEFPWELGYEICSHKTIVSWLPDGVNCTILRLFVLTHYGRVTASQPPSTAHSSVVL